MEVTIYTTPTCTYCRAAKEFFKQFGVTYKEIDVAAEPAQAQVVIAKSGQLGVPVITIEKNGTETVILGFDQPKLKTVLGV